MTQDDELERLKTRVAELETALKQTDRTIETVFRLPPALSKLMGLLLALPHVTERGIAEHTKIATVGKVAIFRLRHELEPLGIKIHSKRAVGWWFDEPTKEHIRKILAGEITLEVSANAA
jgi:hypothetical protein